MSSFLIGAQALFEALLAQGYPMVMQLHDPLLQQTLGFKTVKAAQRRLERGNFPPVTRIGRGTTVMLPDLAAWLASKSAAAQADAAPQSVSITPDRPPPPRRRGRPRKGGAA
jgi:hypothetical protein